MIIHSRLTQLIFVLSIFAFLSNDISSTQAGEKSAGIDDLIAGAIQGTDTGLPLPRFVSLKTKRTNMRIGPSLDHRISWVFVKPGVPVEVVQEFEVWRRIRDADGQEGWVHKVMLSYKRKAIVAPWAGEKYFPLHKKPLSESRETAKLQSGVYSDIESCRDEWCQVSGNNYSGWVRKNNLWGVYADESVR